MRGWVAGVSTAHTYSRYAGGAAGGCKTGGSRSGSLPWFKTILVLRIPR